MKIFAFTAVAVLLATDVAAQGVYVCMQPNGVREYRNTGDTTGCRRLSAEALSAIPAPPGVTQAVTQSASPSPAQSAVPSGTPAGTQAKADAGFPRIDSQLQKRRDQDRMQILLDEIRTEETKLTELRKEYQNGEPERLGSERNYAKYLERVALMKDEIARTEKNIEALKREIGNLK